MNSKNNKTSDHQRLLFNLSDKAKLKKGVSYFGLSNLSIYHIWKI